MVRMISPMRMLQEPPKLLTPSVLHLSQQAAARTLDPPSTPPTVIPLLQNTFAPRPTHRRGHAAALPASSCGNKGQHQTANSVRFSCSTSRASLHHRFAVLGSTLASEIASMRGPCWPLTTLDRRSSVGMQLLRPEKPGGCPHCNHPYSQQRARWVHSRHATARPVENLGAIADIRIYAATAAAHAGVC
eukprot:SAG31_NODE_2_length_46263_cov_45.908043_41_plen_189_part_00